MSDSAITQLRDFYYLGCYTKVVEQAEVLLGGDDALAEEAASLYSRALLAQQRADEAVSWLQERDNMPYALLLAEYVQARRAGRAAAATTALSQATEAAIGQDEAVDSGITATLLAQTLLIAEQYTEAVAVLKRQPRHVECAALRVQAYLAMGRRDLAQQELELAKQWADDAIPLQLAEAWVNLTTGGDRYQSTEYIFDEFGINAAISAGSLCGQAVSQLLMHRFPEAEALLIEAQASEKHHPEVLANLAVTLYLSGRPAEAVAQLSALEEQHPEHPLVQARQTKSALFDTAAAAYV